MGHSCQNLLWEVTKLPPIIVTLTHQVINLHRRFVQPSKRAFQYETSRKSDTSSLQNESFVRNSLQESRVKCPKRAFWTGVKSPKPALARDLHAVLPSNLIIPGACHANCITAPPHTQSTVPRHVWPYLHRATPFGLFSAYFLSTLTSTKIATLPEACHGNKAPRQALQEEIPIAQGHSTAPKITPRERQSQWHSTQSATSRNAATAQLSRHTCNSYTNQTRHPSTQDLVQKLLNRRNLPTKATLFDKGEQVQPGPPDYRLMINSKQEPFATP